MNIRSRIILAFLAIIIVLGGGLLYITDQLVVDELRTEHIVAAKEGVQRIAEINYALSRRILSAYGERIVELQAEAAINEIALLLKDVPQPWDYEKLRNNAELRAAATPDILTWDGVAGYIDVLDMDGVAIWHPNKQVEGRNFSEWKDEFPIMWELVVQSFSEERVKGYYTFLDKNTQEHRDKYMVLLRVPDTHFIVAATVYIDDYFLPVHQQIRNEANIAIEQAKTAILDSAGRSEHRARILVFSAVLAMSTLAILVGVFFSGSIAAPIQQLKEGVEKIGGGDFSARVEQRGPPETVHLARAFNNLSSQLTEYMVNLEKEVSARQAVESELAVARQIQQSLVPHTFPPFPHRHEFDLFAQLLPAKEVAGDYYDFFFVDKDRLALIVGDVSGKSVPAAFFMAVTRTLLRSICNQATDPAEALTMANRILMQDNDACMFVTLFLACYHVKTGEISYANAGHLESILIPKDGSPKFFGRLEDPMLGITPVEKFKSGSLTLKPGDRMVLYTDGITEANSPTAELYGAKRFCKLLEQHKNSELREICAATGKAIHAFQNGMLYDDATILILQHNIQV